MRACCEGPSRAEARRQRITDAARKLFADNGFHATGIAQIARESGVAVGQIYRDFCSKEEIVAALIGRDCVRLLRVEGLEAAIRAADTDSVRKWLHDFIDPAGGIEDARIFVEIIAEAARNPRMTAIVAGVKDELRGHILAALALLAPGKARAGRRAAIADAIMTISLGVLTHQLIRPALDMAALLATIHAVLDRELAALVDADAMS